MTTSPAIRLRSYATACTSIYDPAIVRDFFCAKVSVVEAYRLPMPPVLGRGKRWPPVRALPKG